MRILSYQPIWLLALAAAPVMAAFDDYYFAGTGRNTSAPRLCGNMPYACEAPNMCSQDTLTKKYYCCEPGSKDSVCWKGRETCNGGDNIASDQQLACVYRQSTGEVKYCCDKETQVCTSREKQFNICWAKADNKLRDLNATRIAQAYTSLLSASPTATSITIGTVQLLSMTGINPTDLPSSTLASSSVPASATPSTTSPASQPAAPANNSGLSGGAIGGIVGGVVGGLALLGAIGFFLWRRRKNNGKIDMNAPPGDPYQGYGYQPGHQPQQQYHEAPYSPQPAMAQPYPPPSTDKYAHHGPVHEVPAYSNPVEMDASYHQQHGLNK